MCRHRRNHTNRFVRCICAASALGTRHSAPITLHDDIPLGSEPIAYGESPYLLDPVYDHFLKGTLPNCSLMEDLCPDEFFKSEFFVRYWKSIDVISEFSFNAAYDADTTIHIALNRVVGSQEFSRSDVDLLKIND